MKDTQLEKFNEFDEPGYGLQVQQFLKNGGQIKSVPEGHMAASDSKKDKHFAKHAIFGIFKSDKNL